MKNFFLLVLIMAAACLTTWGQEAADVRTSALEGSGRFEVIPLKGALYRLDKYAGRIHRMTSCPRDDGEGSKLCWKEMTIVDPPKGFGANKPHFQILSANGYVLLLFLDTGQTWQFGVPDPQEKWHPFIECNDRTSPTCFWRP